MDKWQEWRWLPSSKVTAVGIAGGIYAWGVWVLITFYGVEFNMFEVSTTQAWVTTLIGYSISEHRPWNR